MFDFEVTRADVSPAHDYILVTTRESGWPVLLQVRGGAIAVQSPGLVPARRRRLRARCYPDPSDCWVEPAAGSEPAGIDRIALSPDGAAAAFFSESRGRIYVFANLSQSPSFLREINVAGLGRLNSFGISDDGRALALGVSDGAAGSLFFADLDRDPSARPIAVMARPSTIAFLHRSHNAVVADDVENTICAVSDGQAFAIATADAGISAPAGIAVSNDNQRIFVANSATGSVMTLSPNGTVTDARSCACTLTGLHPTSADSVFRLTDYSGRPIVLFDASNTPPRITYVRAGSP